MQAWSGNLRQLFRALGGAFMRSTHTSSMASSRQFSGESLITNSNLPACQRACGKSFGQLHKHYVQASHSRLTGAAAQPCDAQRQQQQRFVLPQRSPAEHRQPPRREAASAAAAAAAAADCGGNGGSGGAAQPRKRTGGGDAGDNRGNSSRPCAPLQLLLALALVLPPAAPLLWPAAASASAVAASKKGKGQREVETSLPAWEVDAFVESLSELTGPLLNNMGFSGLLGAASAAALKFVGRTLAAAVGLGLVLVQVLSHYNVVTVNWSVVHRQAAHALDRTGDGRLDQDDCKRLLKQGLVVLTEGVPSASGFLAGFLLGMKVF